MLSPVGIVNRGGGGALSQEQSTLDSFGLVCASSAGTPECPLPRAFYGSQRPIHTAGRFYEDAAN
jgi:hypothetical protein